MDLLATVKKSGSRGGAGDFKWSEVETSSHRENYLGHSLMAPVGRWQKNRDLNWYAKGDSADGGENESAEEKAARQRAEEIKRVKEAEQDALAKALGLPVPDRSNPNREALGDRRELEKVVQETAGDGHQDGMGIGYDKHARGRIERSADQVVRIEGNAEQQDKELQFALKEYKRRQETQGTQSLHQPG
jgi:Multiple myeloma tumor-associated